MCVVLCNTSASSVIMYVPIPIYLLLFQGPKVAELSRSIELQLSGRHKKKPTGGVDLSSTSDSNQLRPESREDRRSPSPNIPVS